MDFLDRFYKKLIVGTHHDHFSIIPNPHKILGFSALFHAGYRYWLFVTTGNMFTYHPYEIGFVVGHLILSCSSFLFPISKRRNFHNQIIWREVQLHNICFSSRSCFVMIYHLTWHGDASVTIWSKCVTAVIVLSHHVIADIITHHYGQGNSMRDSAWDENTLLYRFKLLFDRFYAVSQFGATAILLCGNTLPLENAFSILFTIQLSTFLMTLRLKGIITNNMWHILYNSSLLLTYYTSAYVGNNRMLVYYILFFYLWRILLRQDKYIGWVAVTLFNIVYYEYRRING